MTANESELRELYERYNCRWSEVAKALHVDKSYISKLLDGSKPMTDAMRERISQLLPTPKPTEPVEPPHYTAEDDVIVTSKNLGRSRQFWAESPVDDELEKILDDFYSKSIDAYHAFMGTYINAESDDEAPDRLIKEFLTKVESWSTRRTAKIAQAVQEVVLELGRDKGRAILEARLDELKRLPKNKLRDNVNSPPSEFAIVDYENVEARIQALEAQLEQPKPKQDLSK